VFVTFEPVEFRSTVDYFFHFIVGVTSTMFIIPEPCCFISTAIFILVLGFEILASESQNKGSSPPFLVRPVVDGEKGGASQVTSQCFETISLLTERASDQHPTTQFFYRLDALPATQPTASKH